MHYKKLSFQRAFCLFLSFKILRTQLQLSQRHYFIHRKIFISPTQYILQIRFCLYYRQCLIDHNRFFLFHILHRFCWQILQIRCLNSCNEYLLVVLLVLREQGIFHRLRILVLEYRRYCSPSRILLRWIIVLSLVHLRLLLVLLYIFNFFSPHSFCPQGSISFYYVFA